MAATLASGCAPQQRHEGADGGINHFIGREASLRRECPEWALSASSPGYSGASAFLAASCFPLETLMAATGEERPLSSDQGTAAFASFPTLDCSSWPPLALRKIGSPSVQSYKAPGPSICASAVATIAARPSPSGMDGSCVIRRRTVVIVSPVTGFVPECRYCSHRRIEPLRFQSS